MKNWLNIEKVRNNLHSIIISGILLSFVGTGVSYGWSGLIASPGDIVTATKWNELINKIYPIYGTGWASGNVWIGDTTPDHKFDVAGNIWLNSSSYINFWDVDGSTWYGFRDNAGILQFKNSAGSWLNIPTTVSSGDNLWNHTATQNIALDTFWLSGDGDDEWIKIWTTWNIAFTTGSYLNFWTVEGTTWYGFRDNAGVLQFKNSAGSWVNFSTSAGIWSLNTLTATNQTLDVGTSGSDFNIYSSWSSHTFNIPDASATARGLITVWAQIFGGDKAFNGNIAIHSNTTLGDASTDTLTINGNNISIPNNLNFDTNTLFIDAANNRVGIWLNNPTEKLQVVWNTIFGSSFTYIPSVPLNLVNSAAATMKTQLSLVNTWWWGGAWSAIDFYTYDVAGGTLPGLRIGAYDNNYSADFAISTKVPGAAANALVERFRIGSTGNVWIGSTSPSTKLDINGDLALQFGADYSTTWTANDVSFSGGTTSNVRYNGTAIATITGISWGYDGKILYFHNASSYNVTLSNQSTSSATSNRIITGNNNDIILATDESATLVYDNSSQRWRIINSTPKRYTYRMTATQSSTSTTMANVTQLTSWILPVWAYEIRVRGKFRTVATTTGIWLTLKAQTAAIGDIWIIYQAQSTATANQQYSITADGTSVTTTATPAANTDYALMMNGTFNVTTAGTVTIQMKSEVNGSTATLGIGTFLTLEPLY